MRQYLEIRCPNLPYEESRDNTTIDHQEVVCNSLLGGIPKALIDNTEIYACFYCSSCKMLWRVHFNGRDIPSFKHMNCKVDFVSIPSKLGLVDIEGRKIKRKKR